MVPALAARLQHADQRTGSSQFLTAVLLARLIDPLVYQTNPGKIAHRTQPKTIAIVRVYTDLSVDAWKANKRAVLNLCVF